MNHPKFSSSTKSLISVLQPHIDSGLFAGGVGLVASKEGVLAIETIGDADIAAKKPMPADALFWIASITKPVTATAMMMLVDDGKAGLDDPVEKYLPEFAEIRVAVPQENDKVILKKPDRSITIRHLLCQMSGFPFLTPLEQPVMDRFSIADIVRIYSMLPLQSEPGARFQYSNENFGTAARIIEVVSGMAFEDFLSSRLFEALGMKDTTFVPNEEQLGRLPKIYKPNEAKTGLEETPITWFTYPLNDRARRHPTPGGGLFSTISDTAAFGRMFLSGGELNGHRYLSPEAFREMTTLQTTGQEEKYGLGWWLTDEGFCHGGAYCTMLWVDIRRGLVKLFFTQTAAFAVEKGNKVIEAAFVEAADHFAATPAPAP